MHVYNMEHTYKKQYVECDFDSFFLVFYEKKGEKIQLVELA